MTSPEHSSPEFIFPPRPFLLDGNVPAELNRRMELLGLTGAVALQTVARRARDIDMPVYNAVLRTNMTETAKVLQWYSGPPKPWQANAQGDAFLTGCGLAYEAISIHFKRDVPYLYYQECQTWLPLAEPPESDMLLIDKRLKRGQAEVDRDPVLSTLFNMYKVYIQDTGYPEHDFFKSGMGFIKYATAIAEATQIAKIELASLGQEYNDKPDGTLTDKEIEDFFNSNNRHTE